MVRPRRPVWCGARGPGVDYAAERARRRGRRGLAAAARADEVRSPRPVSAIAWGPAADAALREPRRAELPEADRGGGRRLPGGEARRRRTTLGAEMVRMLAARRGGPSRARRGALGSGEALRGVDWVETATARGRERRAATRHLRPIAAAREGVVDGVVPRRRRRGHGEGPAERRHRDLERGRARDYADDVGAFVRYAKQPGFDATPAHERRYKRGLRGHRRRPAYAPFASPSSTTRPSRPRRAPRATGGRRLSSHASSTRRT